MILTFRFSTYTGQSGVGRLEGVLRTCGELGTSEFSGVQEGVKILLLSDGLQLRGRVQVRRVLQGVSPAHYGRGGSNYQASFLHAFGIFGLLVDNGSPETTRVAIRTFRRSLPDILNTDSAHVSVLLTIVDDDGGG